MLGVLQETISSQLFAPEAGEPVRPGKDGPLLLAARHGKARSYEDLLAVAGASARESRERAKRLASSRPSSTTLAALAQSHAVLGETAEALDAARQALALSLEPSSTGSASNEVSDAIAARMACEVMHRFGAAEEALTALRRVAALPRSLRLTLASIAIELDRFDDAMNAIEGQSGALIDSFRGFVLASQGDHRRAIPHLRSALRESPDDVAAAMNLSVSLWAIGSREKAVAAALRASRIAPGRKDASLHYLDLLLEIGDNVRLSEEIKSLLSRNVVADAHFLVVQARASLAKGAVGRAIAMLDKAVAEAEAEGNDALKVEVKANLALLKHRTGRWTYRQTMDALSALLRDYPDDETVIMSFARTATRMSEAPALRSAITRLGPDTAPGRQAFLRYQLAYLEGDNEAAAAAAVDWFRLDSKDPLAAGAAMVALGIGMERWKEAADIAEISLRTFPEDLSIINNAGYVLAMAGRSAEAVGILERHSSRNFVLKATLGLACLANGEFDRGMRLYREAARMAEKEGGDRLSLMVSYQALVARQLGLDEVVDGERLSASALVPPALPSDWEDHAEFVRLRNVCTARGYDWPLAI